MKRLYELTINYKPCKDMEKCLKKFTYSKYIYNKKWFIGYFPNYKEAKKIAKILISIFNPYSFSDFYCIGYEIKKTYSEKLEVEEMFPCQISK